MACGQDGDRDPDRDHIETNTPDYLLYDEDGSLTLARARRRADAARDEGPACPVKTLNGSWYLHFVPDGPHVVQLIRGPMRIEVARPRLRISGDVYVGKRGAADQQLHLARVT